MTLKYSRTLNIILQVTGAVTSVLQRQQHLIMTMELTQMSIIALMVLMGVDLQDKLHLAPLSLHLLMQLPMDKYLLQRIIF